MLFGPPGTGKTAALACAYQRWPANGKAVIWEKCQALIRKFSECRSNGLGYIDLPSEPNCCWQFTPEKFLEKCETAALIVIDDIGTRDMNAAQRDTFMDIIDARGNRPMLCTSNFSPDELEKLTDARIVSRLLAGRWIKVCGPDRRQSRKILGVDL